MNPRVLPWLIIILSVAVVAVIAFVFFRNDNPVLQEVTRSESINLDVTSETSGTTPDNAESILPYLSSPSKR